MLVKHQWMVLAAFVFAVISAGAFRAAANSEMREWKLSDGTSLSAEIASVDEGNERLVLRDPKGGEKTIPFTDLSKLDKAWVLEWIEMNEELAAKAAKLGGKFERFDGKGAKFTTGYYVYQPSGAVDPASPRPMMILFDPSGLPVRYLLRHIEAAEETKVTLVTCDHFSNQLSEEAGRERFEEVFPLIESSVTYDKKRLYLGGTSGGALRAFVLSAKLPGIKLAGIYSNGGWLGGDELNKLPFQACRVCMVNGDKDSGAGFYADSDTRILQGRGCTVGLFAFEGGHQVPPSSVQTKAFRWLLGEFN